MLNKNTHLQGLLLLIIFLSVAFSHAQIRKKTTLNSHWKFHKGVLNPDFSKNIEGEIVNLPHTWNNKDVLNDHKPGHYRGEGWYSKIISLFPDLNEKSYFLQFEGVGQVAEVFVNGHKAGSHVGGYTGFTLNITPFLKADNNILHIKVDNAHNPDIPPLSADFTFFGGIYRDVFLIETSKTHFNLSDNGSTGLFISTPNVKGNSSEIQLKGSFISESKNKLEIQLKVLDAQRKTVLSTIKRLKSNTGLNTFEIKSKLTEVNLWSPDNPYLYTAEISIIKDGNILDEENIRFGFRSFYFHPENGFFLNGSHLKLIGANRHQDYYGDGVALSDDVHRHDLKILKDMGANFIRLAHYPQDPAVLEAADELGLLVWQETPLVNEVTLSEAHDNNAETILIEMIRQYYNHPSIILWGYMNEIYWAHRFLDENVVDAHTEATVKLAKRLENVVRNEDPTRYTVMALHHYPLYETSGLGDIPQVVGWNLYHGWYYDNFEDLGKFLDEEHKKHPERIHILSEFGSGSDQRLHSLKPERFDFTMEGQKAMIESYLTQIMERNYLAGATYWNLVDFNSEKRVDTKPHWNQKGLLSSKRVPKDPYYLFQATLLKEPFIKIAETNWQHRVGVSDTTPFLSPVDIYTNQKTVQLEANGKLLEEKIVKNNKVTFNVPLSIGENQLLAISNNISDYITINFRNIPVLLKEQYNIDISINAGSNHSFFDEKGANVWVEDQPYRPESWGYIGGEQLYVGKKIGTKEKILTIDSFIPLYQTIREGIEAYRFDVEDGWYEVELLFVEPFPKSRRFVGNDVSPSHLGGKRIFDVLINNQPWLQNLDLLKDYGYNYPLREKTKIKVTEGKGLSISFKAIKGKPIVSGVKLRSLN
ncbi:glycoside hydrolase family 2 [Aureibaculum marinum]|uniref:Glycoside hydrolase family 2 n=1 Tax=Aureibaculum marinum TaxID=2487930 RepID=A0A3N4NDE3_9FLAO|nr:glycoside hydrolase family 2 TIM barrel-domain containing protein [Aureibaculum marinum]RPD93375.1 glycoside hydrolase family 2 [Aureibaculum marinum]